MNAASAASAAGAVYVMAIFSLGFVLGALRESILRAGVMGTSRTVAVLIEIPIMLVVSWFVCARITKRMGVSDTIMDRFIMGTVAFVLLMMAEPVLGYLLFGRSLIDHVRSYGDLSHAIGLAGQLGFAALPLLQRHRPSSP